VTARFSLRLPQRQARLVALAVAYHLARPGSELDRDTMREYEHGLADAAAKATMPWYTLLSGAGPGT
jgi:hypothetical protein